jgi:hypothetical protein
MPYLPVPLPVGSKPSSTYQNLNTNATEANNQYGDDHVAFDAGANNGMHSKATFPIGIAAPTATGTQQIVYPRGSGSTLGLNVVTAALDVGLTNIPSTTVGMAPFQVQRMVTPWGLILYYGVMTNNSSSGFTLTYTNSAEVTQFATINGINIQASGVPAFRVSSAAVGSAAFVMPSQNLTFNIFVVTRIP